MENTAVFSQKAFQNPANVFRPLQIIHGFDYYTGESGKDDGEGVGQDLTKFSQQNIQAFLKKLVDMGTGGIVTNVGFNDYLVSARQWDLLREGLRAADKLGLKLWLYDEKGYPSGTAGGYVTRANPEMISLGLACYTVQAQTGQVVFPLPASCGKFMWAGAARSLDSAECGDVIDLSSQVDAWGTLCWDLPAPGAWTVLYLAERVMYEGTHSAGNVCEFKAYINPLMPEATRAFIRLTHEAYHREIPADLWEKIDAIFTDEPSFMTSYIPALPERFIGKIPVVDQPIFTDRPPAVPWRRDFLELFKQVKGYDLRPHLFELFHSESPEACSIRQDYYEVITQVYSDAFFGQIQDWCRDHNIESSGHVLLEESILDHGPYQGSLLKVLRRMDLPGIDMLNSDPQGMIGNGSFMGESFMAIKQATSAAHLAGKKRIHSESSDWEQHNQDRFASLDERRGQGNLQFVLGVNLITSYFGWDEIGDEGWKQYNNYMGRLSSLLTGGIHACDVAVLYPIRTIWAHTLPSLEPIPTWDVRMERIRSPWIKQVATEYPQVVKRLLCSQVDLDIIDEEALLNGQVQDGALHVSDEAYHAIVLPPMDVLSIDAAKILLDFTRSGGFVFSIGSLPTQAERADQQDELAVTLSEIFGVGGTGKVIDLTSLPDSIHDVIEPDFSLAASNPNILYTHRVSEGRHIYFVTNIFPQTADIQPRLSIPGPYRIYRPLDGTQSTLEEPIQIRLEGNEGVFIVAEG